jgi:hypothetical protein
MPFPRTGEVKIAAYQFESPYIPENNYLEEEWIVLKNKDIVAVNMSGWRINNFNFKNAFTLPAFVLAPGASVKIHTGSGLDTETDLYMGKKDEFWNNNVDRITVYDSSGQVVDSWYGLARNQHPGV